MSQLLWQSICDKENFLEAWHNVRANVGAPGVDKVSVIDFETNLDENIDLLLQLVKSGSYQPLPYISFKKEKAGGEYRELKIATIRDKVVQQAILIQLQPIYEKVFLDCSYAYRPQKSALKAVDRVERNIKKGRHWIFDADIENFFDNVDREILINTIAQKIDDKKVIKLIKIIINSEESPNNKGISQGAPLSPMLSNIYLHSFDDLMNRAQWNYVRYSDNLVVLCHEKEEAETAFAKARELLEKDLKLNFNKEKTKIVHASEGFIFLGYYFDLKGKKPCAASVKKMQSKVELTLRRAATFSSEELKSKLDSIIRGWMNYFQLRSGNYLKLFDELKQKWQSENGTISHNIFLIALAIAIGKREIAEEMVTKITIEDFSEADIYFQWGILCELLDRDSEAVDAYHAAYRLNCNHAETAYRLGIHFLNQKNMEKALRFLQKAVQLKPDWAQAQFFLATALKTFNLEGAARKAFSRAYELDPSLKKKRESQIYSQKKGSATCPSFCFNAQNIQVLQSLFSCREGVFAHQWCDKTGRTGYSPIYHPMSKQDIKQHLSGKETLGLYLLRSDNTVSFLVIDIDIVKQHRAQLSSVEFAEHKWDEMAHVEAVSIQNLAQKLGISAYIENSGHKGRHVWLFFAIPIPAREAIAFAKRIVEHKGPIAPGITLEIFPKEPRVGPKGLGSLIKMPLGIHKLTGKRCFFLESNGRPFNDQWYVINNIQKLNRNQFDQAFEKLRTGRIEFDQKNIDTGKIEKMIEKCNVLKYLLEKVEKEHCLSHVDRLTILHTVGHFEEAGRYMVHKIISKAFNYDHRITERWIKRLKGSPVSCPKIRDWQGHITPSIGCFCQFPETSKCYPTPILHVIPGFTFKKRVTESPVTKEKKISQQTKSDVKETAQRSAEQSKNKIQEADKNQTRSKEIMEQDIESLVADFIKLNQQITDVNEKKKKLELRLETIFNKKNCDRLILKMGVLRRVKDGEGFKYLIEI